MLTETILKIPIFGIDRCSPVLTPHWMQGKWAKIYLSQAANSMILKNHKQLPVRIFSVKIAAWSLSRVIKRIFEISK
jgi:hypothetical protein